MSGGLDSGGARLIVLQSVKQPTTRTNPYIIQLVDSLSEHVDVRYFSWRFALLGRYDVLHLHWPEVMIRRESRLSRYVAMARFLLLMLRLTGQRRIAVVRTRHNLGLHESGGRVEHLLLTWCDRRTDHWIALNEQTPAPPGGALTVILHGDYGDWYPAPAEGSVQPGRVLYFGLIRPYKGVDTLLQAFAATPAPDLTLRIVGRPVTPELATLVERACRADPRTTALLDYVDDATLAGEIAQAQLVVLPYQDMHNSGALLLALSLERPVLVPRAPVTVALAGEVGPGWVRTYDGPLSAEVLQETVAELRAGPPPAAPDLSRRRWTVIGAQHAALYRSLVRPSRR